MACCVLRSSSIFSLRKRKNTVSSVVIFASLLDRGLKRMFSDARYLSIVRHTIPDLRPSSHKGQAGRVAVVGGSQEYTGAPYFAAISALKVGADLSHVFCTSDSALVIKSYSPELIVHPLLDKKTAVSGISEWLERMHSIVLGPGLGRDPGIMEHAMGVIEKAKELNKQLVVDADGLFLVTSHPDVIANYRKAVLTPNKVEFARLYKKMFGCDPDLGQDTPLQVTELSRRLGGVTICRKGVQDVISDGQNVIVCAVEGSSRRCGGQGDLLSGSMGTFMHWAQENLNRNKGTESVAALLSPTLVAAFGACALTRTCNRLAFKKHRRSMTTSDMVEEIGQAFETLFEQPLKSP